MKRLSVFVITMLLGASLAFAQNGGGTTGQPADSGKTTETGKKSKKGGKKGHKGGKKGKKGTDTATPAPK
jgi:hypothetical protein